jgi:hypothetical protein
MVSALQVTSALFGTVVLAAYYARCAVYHHLFLLVTVFSVWFHSTHDPWIAGIDKCIAHAAFITVIVIDGPRIIAAEQWLLAAFPLSVGALWLWEMALVKKKRADEEDAAARIHVALHVASLLGLHAFLAVLYDRSGVVPM